MRTRSPPAILAIFTIVMALLIGLWAHSDMSFAATVQPQADAESFMAADTDVATEAAPVHALSTVMTTSAPDAATLDTTAIDSDTQFATGAGSGLYAIAAPDASVTTLDATALDGTLAAQEADTTSGVPFAVDGNTLTRAVIAFGIGAVFLVCLTSYILMARRRSRVARRRRLGEDTGAPVQPRHPGTTHADQAEREDRGGPIPIAGPLGTGQRPSTDPAERVAPAAV
jgi:hypothetical protein